jgi:hypothetical protein
MEIIENYKKALQSIYDHVGFVEDYVVYPIADSTDMYWDTDGETVWYAEDKDDVLNRTGNHYEAEVYTQRFYNKWVYEGKDFTMIFTNPGVDGMKYFSLFDNSKRLR